MKNQKHCISPQYRFAAPKTPETLRKSLGTFLYWPLALKKQHFFCFQTTISVKEKEKNNNGLLINSSPFSFHFSRNQACFTRDNRDSV